VSEWVGLFEERLRGGIRGQEQTKDCPEKHCRRNPASERLGAVAKVRT
jgi:hypothetical protein